MSAAEALPTGSVPAAPAESLAPADSGPDAAAKANSKLFGRGLLYVVVWALQLVASSLISPILAHVMAPAQFGALASAIALYQVLSLFAVLGFDQAIVLQRADDGNDKRARGLITVALCIASAVTVIALASEPLWGPALGFSDHSLLVVAVVLWTAPAAGVQVALSMLVAQDRLKVFSVISIISAVGGSVVGLVLLELVHNDAITYAWGGVICQFIAMAIGLSVVRPSFRNAFDRETTMRALRFGVPMALGGLAYFVLNAGDRIIIQRMIGAEEVARYQVAYVVGSAVILLLTYTNSAWTPHFAALKTDEDRWELAMRSRDQLYRLLMPIVLAVTLVSPFALPILAPASYDPRTLTPVVFLVAITAYPVAASGATGRLLFVRRKSIAIGIIAGVAALVNIGANIVLVPIMGIAGAALATFVSYSVLAFLQLRSIPRTPRWRGAPWIVVLGIVGSLAVAAASMLLPQDTMWNLIRVAAAVACFPWFLNRLRAARDQDPKPRRGRRRAEATVSTRASRASRPNADADADATAADRAPHPTHATDPAEESIDV